MFFKNNSKMINVDTNHEHASSVFIFPTVMGGSYQEIATCYGMCQQRVVHLGLRR